MGWKDIGKRKMPKEIMWWRDYKSRIWKILNVNPSMDLLILTMWHLDKLIVWGFSHLTFLKMIPPLSKCYYESWLQQLHKAPNTVSETLQMLRKRNFLLKITFCSHFSRSIDNTDFYLVNWACDLKKKKVPVFIYSTISFPPLFFFSFWF